jgi:hypothetical protein
MSAKRRYEVGLEKLATTEESVAGMQVRPLPQGLRAVTDYPPLPRQSSDQCPKCFTHAQMS